MPIAGGANLAFALDTLGVKAATAQIVAFDVRPATFVAPTTLAAGLVVPTLAANQAIGIWIRRQIAAGAPLTPERTTLTISGTTPA
jgi:competence transcription factor ComK